MSEMMQDPMFFYTIAFVIFLALAYRFARKPLLSWLDTEIVKIRDELDQAQKLRREAEAALAQYKAKEKEALAEADAIIRFAKEEAANLRSQAEADLKAALIRHEQQAAERIRIAETEAMAEVRKAAADLAVTMAKNALSTMTEADASKLADIAITDIPNLASKKAKAA